MRGESGRGDRDEDESLDLKKKTEQISLVHELCHDLKMLIMSSPRDNPMARVSTPQHTGK